MRWERFFRHCAFAIILFLLVNALETAKLPGTEGLRTYLAYAFTSDWDYRPVLERAREGARSLSTFTGRLSPPAEKSESAPAGAPSVSDAVAAPETRPGPASTPARTPEPAAAPRAPSTVPPPAADTGTSALSPSGARLTWPVQGWVSERFGRRAHPITRLVGPHEGIDIAAPEGRAVHAAAGGKVTAAFRGLTAGLTVDVAHQHYTTRYAHLSAIKVRVGQEVAAGAVIGLVGSTGVATGPHLHFEVRQNGQPVDPLTLLPR